MNMSITASRSFDVLTGLAPKRSETVDQIQEAISKLPQYEPETNHYFHGGMYCREVHQRKDALIVGKVHKKEHFFILTVGTIAISQDGEPAIVVSSPSVIKSLVGTKRAILSVTDVSYMTVHACSSLTVQDAEDELVERDPKSMFTVGNKVADGVLKFESE